MDFNLTYHSNSTQSSKVSYSIKLTPIALCHYINASNYLDNNLLYFMNYKVQNKIIPTPPSYEMAIVIFLIPSVLGNLL